MLDISEATIADPEILYNYELGYKGSFLDHRLTFNITGFFMDYQDQQVLISSPTPFGLLPNLQNAGASEIKGFEFELHAQPTQNWYLQVGGGYLDAKFTEFFDPTIPGLDRAGNQLPHAPEWNFNAIVRYEVPLQERLARPAARRMVARRPVLHGRERGVAARGCPRSAECEGQLLVHKMTAW